MKKIIILSMLCVLFISCKDEVIQTLDLSATSQNDQSIKLSWTNPKIAGFKFYQIMRSSDGKNYSTITNSTTITTQSWTTYTDNTFPLVDSVFYKVIAVGDDAISSPNIKVKINKPFILDNQPATLTALPDECKVAALIYDNGYKMAIIDMTTKTIERETTTNYPSSYDYITTGKYNGSSEIYYYSENDDRIYVYDAETLAKKYSSASSYYLSSAKIICDKNGIIYFISRSNSYIYAMNRQGVVLSNSTSQSIYDLKYDSVSNTIQALSYSAIVTYNTTATGLLTQKESKTIPSNYYYTFIPNTNYIYSTNDTYPILYDCRNGATTTINPGYSVASIISSGNYLYCIPTYSNNNKEINCYKLETLALEKKIATRGYIYKSASNNNYLFITENYTSNYSSYYILEQIDLIK